MEPLRGAGLHAWPGLLFQPGEVKRGRAARLLFCQLGGEPWLAAKLDLVDRHGNEFIAKAEESADREDHRHYGRTVKIDQNVFDLPNGRVPLVNLAADQLACPGASRQRRRATTPGHRMPRPNAG